eukprot:924475-Alexandrium_andersonii.AAC.1
MPAKAWSWTQPTRAQSSAEAEAVSIEVGVSEGIGVQRIMEFPAEAACGLARLQRFAGGHPYDEEAWGLPRETLGPQGVVRPA